MEKISLFKLIFMVYCTKDNKMIFSLSTYKNEGGYRHMAKKILVVDDEPHIVRLVEVNLQRRGYEVVRAGDGIEALERVGSEKPDMIILDVMMPRMNGFETLKELQLNPKTRSIPVIMLTAKAQDSDVFKGWQSGVSAYLTKPFNPKELLIFVDRIFIAINDGGQPGLDGTGWGSDDDSYQTPPTYRL
jgi:two-component system alkaline phosphatase synthesis response regulator PhoP/two-component system response regulator VicR